LSSDKTAKAGRPEQAIKSRRIFWGYPPHTQEKEIPLHLKIQRQEKNLNKHTLLRSTPPHTYHCMSMRSHLPFSIHISARLSTLVKLRQARIRESLGLLENK
jgi:hypothetical protein